MKSMASMSWIKNKKKMAGVHAMVSLVMDLAPALHDVAMWTA